ncbi:MAG TPA: phosphomethylpyrimidine synthase ThiC [Firmicutes bacterium]|jgi:phosphomethylpyrimidine synthase|nr:phosphomethylpyrimidine synthase ThiC [Bacillota bacterium]HOQ24519.1 phosphomethylpyrimidine synthase ThiC [Bacillota bacterium]HPT67341.1 phosphomethylpyrimidine synthase ThiC [Bacillota bacterium]
MSYKTQMEAARLGIVTPQMRRVAEKERMEADTLRQRLAAGKVVIPCNRQHTALDPHGIGDGLRTKINVNLGVSGDRLDFDLELAKARLAMELGAEAIMDLSCFGHTETFRRQLIDIATAAVGTVPVYDAIGYYQKELPEITAEEFLGIVRKHAADGVDFMTIHAGITRETAARFKKTGRLTNIVSRGGALLFAWMELTGNENPFYEHFDEVLRICAKYDVTISLGDACRPGSIEDATDACQIQELIVLGELVKRAWSQNVQVMVEGPGHMALNEIAANMLLEKKLCHGAPFYVLGPLVTDVAPGYDHITSAIGGAVAAMHGADFLCYVTPAEHLRLPELEDVREGIIAAKIAAHAADIAKNIPGTREWDYQMSTARRNFDWEQMFRLAIDPVKPRQYRTASPPKEEDSCTMCGKLCAVRTVNKILADLETA